MESDRSFQLVNVKQGILKGSVKENAEGGKYIVFQGIPYAEPPVGVLRFKVIFKINFPHF